MKIVGISLKNFRCFEKIELAVKGLAIFFTGKNGSGKTSLLEALHYPAYLKSFRTHSPRELILEGKEAFVIQLQLEEQGVINTLTVSFSLKKRVIRINGQVINDYQDLLTYYRVITLSSDDILLIQGNPDYRRLFLDQALMMRDPSLVKTMKLYKYMIEQRNALLAMKSKRSDAMIWTEKVWHYGSLIQEARKNFVECLKNRVDVLQHSYLGKELEIDISYIPRKDLSTSFEHFIEMHKEQLEAQESRWGRTCFGPHLDDLSIIINARKSKQFASRGQQKMAALLLKAAFLQELESTKGKSIFLIDDFFAEFDEERQLQAWQLLYELKSQLVFTCPTTNGFFQTTLQKYDSACHISLSS